MFFKRKGLKDVFAAHSGKVIDVNEFTRLLGQQLQDEKLALTPKIKLREWPGLIFKAVALRRAHARLMRDQGLQARVKSAMGDESFGNYYAAPANPHSAYIGSADYMKVDYQIFLQKTRSLRALAFVPFSLKSLASTDASDEKIIAAAEVALEQCRNYAEAVTSGAIKPAPLETIFVRHGL